MMKERERIVVGGLVSLMLILWLGFLVHRSPRFAGSAWGGVLAVTGSSLMLVPLIYLFIKRIKPLKKRVTRYVSMRTVLAWHIYAGVLGPILVVLHTGHKFESPLGIALTTMTLVVVVSGFIGRYLMSRIGQEIREKQAMRGTLNDSYQEVCRELATLPDERRRIHWLRHLIPRLAFQVFATDESMPPAEISFAGRATRLAESIADVEYAIRTHAAFKKAFRLWLKVHIAISIVLYLLMALHVWSAIHFGLRWFE